jgi:biopolymer transport protein ExbD
MRWWNSPLWSGVKAIMPAKWHATSLKASFVSLLVILVALVASPSNAAKGFRVDIAMPSKGMCGDRDRSLFASVLPDGSVRLNEEDVELGKLDSRLQEIFSNRTERVIFVISDEAATFGQVAAFIDVAKRWVDHVALLSHAVLRDPGNCGPVLPMPQQPDVPKPDLKFVPLWPW